MMAPPRTATNRACRVEVAVAFSQRGLQSLQDDPLNPCSYDPMAKLGIHVPSAKYEESAQLMGRTRVLCTPPAPKPHPGEWYIILPTLHAFNRRISFLFLIPRFITQRFRPLATGFSQQ
jgi:hypothetical protein